MATLDELFAQGWQCQQAGDLAAAERLYLQILRTDPSDARAWFALGTIRQAQGRLPEATDCFQRAVRFRPEEAEGHFYLGNAYLAQRRLAEAEAAYHQCLGRKHEHAEALANLGLVLSEQDRLAEAQACYARAVQLRPDYAELHHNLANSLRDLGKPEESLPHYREALRLKPDYVKGLMNLGIALATLGRAEEAVGLMRRALQLQPDLAEAYSSLGAAVSTQGKFEEAVEHYQTSIRLRPDYAEAHWNLALSWLLLGNFEQGWPEFEWRWKCKRTATLPPFTQPCWDGAPLDGKTILLQEEQGLGDVLQFIRYAPLVKARGGTVWFHCPKGLQHLVATCPGIDRIIPGGAPLPAFDVYAPLMSLPRLFGTTLANVPAKVPYVFADPQLAEHWRLQLAPVRGFRIGIAWQGNPNHPWDRHRSVPLAAFEALAKAAGVHLVSLQKGPGTEQLGSLESRFRVIAAGSLLDEVAGGFMDTAAILHNLDLVVTPDTALAHLAGAMGIPVWVALCFSPDWRWLVGRDDSPWYPTLRLFRQTTPGDWDGVFGRMAEALRQSRPPRPAPLLAEVSAGELIDKITILEIKKERISDPEKLSNVRAELATLTATWSRAQPASAELARLTAELKAVNERLWDVEDKLRRLEHAADFGPRFVELARSVYRTNDRRAALKRQVNDLVGSRLKEEKSYPPAHVR